jgi:hypothetical protein
VNRRLRRLLLATALGWPAMAGLAADTVATAIYSRVGAGYTRERQPDGSWKPEFYALANGGRIDGTVTDVTVDRVTYPEVATIAARLLAEQNYHYAQSKEQATLMIVLQWGATLAYNGVNYAQAAREVSTLAMQLQRLKDEGTATPEELAGAIDALDHALALQLTENRARDQVNLPNARILGYLDEINDANGIQRWAGGGDRYRDLVADVEEPRYYIVISAYDFPGLVNHGKKKLRWQTRVSVRTTGNSFDDSVAAMLKGASKYFGQDSGRIVRGEEAKGTVELGDLKFLGEVKPSPEKTGVEGGKK